jgi:hypothetical protein
MHARRKQISQKGTRKTVTTTTPNITMTTESRMKVKKQKKGRRLYVKKLHARLGFKKLESCGLLVQFVGCSASYLEEGVLGFGEKVLKVYESILRHRTVVGMFQRGQPCGDTLKSVLNGTDGHVLKSKKVVGYLRTLSKMAEIANDSINTIHLMRKATDAQCAAIATRLKPTRTFKNHLRLVHAVSKYFIAQENVKLWTGKYIDIIASLHLCPVRKRLPFPKIS